MITNKTFEEINIGDAASLMDKVPFQLYTNNLQLVLTLFKEQLTSQSVQSQQN